MKRIEIYRKLIPQNDGPNQIETQLIYDKGGPNIFGSATKTRGFYFCIQPQWIEPSATPGLTLITLKSGTPSHCQLIKSVSKYTDKAYQQAKEIFKQIEFDVLNEFCKKHGYELEDKLQTVEKEKTN